MKTILDIKHFAEENRKAVIIAGVVFLVGFVIGALIF